MGQGGFGWGSEVCGGRMFLVGSGRSSRPTLRIEDDYVEEYYLVMGAPFTGGSILLGVLHVGGYEFFAESGECRVFD